MWIGQKGIGIYGLGNWGFLFWWGSDDGFGVLDGPMWGIRASVVGFGLVTVRVWDSDEYSGF